MTYNFNTWLDTYIEEKGLDVTHVFTVFSRSYAVTHIIPFTMIVDAAKATTPGQQQEIFDALCRIDFTNQPAMPFFNYLAQRLVETTEALI